VPSNCKRCAPNAGTRPEILVIYIDGQRFGAHHILSAVGVDREGRKHILGIEAGATENAAAIKRLLTHLR
jgi:putative transposase